jgi:hypothetical protein
MPLLQIGAQPRAFQVARYQLQTPGQGNQHDIGVGPAQPQDANGADSRRKDATGQCRRPRYLLPDVYMLLREEPDRQR